MVKKLETLADGFNFLEGPRWYQQNLWVSDMWSHAVYKVSEEGITEKAASIPERPSGLNFLPDGRLVVVSMADRRLMEVSSDGQCSEYADLSGFSISDINDSVVDIEGNIFVGNFGYDMLGGEDPKDGSIFRVDATGEVTIAAESMKFPNGTVVTADGRTLICSETFGSVLTAFDLQGGLLTNRRVWADLGEHLPDGICLDQEGCIWVSSFAAETFLRVKEGGEIVDAIASPGKKAIACNLGGQNGRKLFALTFEGEIEDVANSEGGARIEVCEVEVPGAGSP